jgi:Ca2+-binding RTX toxin-like protein
LEDRKLLASVSLSGTELLIQGNPTDDTISLIGNTNSPEFTVSVAGEPSLTQTFQNDQITKVTVFAGDGDDFVANTLEVPTVIYGQGGNDTLRGGYADDIINGGDGNDDILGRTGNDVLNGQNDDDTISGGYGNDTITGGLGNDVLSGDQGDDQINGHSGNDLINGGVGADTLTGSAGNDSISGGDGDDNLNGGDGDDSLEGNQGEDTLVGETGDDFLSGGNGNDTLYGNDGNDELFGGSGDDIIFGAGGDDIIEGGLGNDELWGQGDNDTLDGQGGDDYVHGGSGNDSLAGGSGADELNGYTGDDTLVGGTDNSPDRLRGGTGFDTFSVQGEIGNGSVDEVLDRFGMETFAGYAGPLGPSIELDGRTLSVVGSNGYDKYHIDDKFNDGTTIRIERFHSEVGSFAISDVDEIVVHLNAGNDKLYVYENEVNTPFRVFGGVGDDLIEGGNGNDWLIGGNGDDTVYGFGGDDLISGYSGDDSLYGGDGDDELHGNWGNDILRGGDGADKVNGGLGNDDVEGGNGNDFVKGNAGNDVLSGNSGADELEGGLGDDLLYAGDDEDLDKLWGDEGFDRFFLDQPEDQLNDLELGETAEPVPSTPSSDGDPMTASIGDLVFEDLDEDGIFDAGEVGLAGIVLRLLQDDTELATATTDSNGAYAFEGLESGSYTVEVVAASLDGRVATTNESVNVSLAADEQNDNIDFGVEPDGFVGQPPSELEILLAEPFLQVTTVDELQDVTNVLPDNAVRETVGGLEVISTLERRLAFDQTGGSGGSDPVGFVGDVPAGFSDADLQELKVASQDLNDNALLGSQSPYSLHVVSSSNVDGLGSVFDGPSTQFDHALVAIQDSKMLVVGGANANATSLQLMLFSSDNFTRNLAASTVEQVASIILGSSGGGGFSTIATVALLQSAGGSPALPYVQALQNTAPAVIPAQTGEATVLKNVRPQFTAPILPDNFAFQVHNPSERGANIFYRAPAGTQATEIGYFQIARVVTGAGALQVDLPTIQAEQDARRVNGWFIDRDTGYKSPYYGVSDTGTNLVEIGGYKTNNYWPGTVATPAVMSDQPTRIPSVTYKFETYAVVINGPDAGKVLAGLEWQVSYLAGGEKPDITALGRIDISDSNALQNVTGAIGGWNDQADGGTGQQTLDVQFP